VGVVFGSLFAGWIADAHGWRSAFAAFGIAGLIWAGVLYWRSPSAPARHENEAPRTSIRETIAVILREPLLIGQTVGFSALVFILVGYLTWMPTILYERFQLSLADAAFSAVAYHHALAAVGLVVGSWFTDRLIGRFPRLRTALMAGSLVACGVLLWLVGFSETTLLVYLNLALFGFFRGLYDANLFAAIFDLVEDRLRSTATGLIVAVAYLVGALAPVVMGWLKQSYGVSASLNLLAAVAVISGLIFAAIVRTARA
jgi:sugar phosphate permease